MGLSAKILSVDWVGRNSYLVESVVYDCDENSIQTPALFSIPNLVQVKVVRA